MQSVTILPGRDKTGKPEPFQGITLERGELCTIVGNTGSGKSRFIKDVEQVTFAAEYAAEVGQKVLYITERAVFELIDGVLTLTEIAPGVDLEKDILAQMEFRPAIAEDLKEMDARIFRDEVMGLSA